MFAQVRRKSILETVNARGFIAVAELCERFSVSPATIRNDLRALEKGGRLERTHGGAISSEKAAYEPSSEQKEDRQVEEKAAIARLALRHIQPGDVIVLDSGTTTFQLAMLLGAIEKLTVVTCDLRIAAWLERNTGVSIIMAGGPVRRHFHCTAGQTATDTLLKLHADKVFMGANGVSLDKGLTTPNMDMAGVKSALVECAEKRVLLADATKIGRVAFVGFCPLTKMDVIITGGEADPDFCAAARNMGVCVELTSADASGRRRPA